MSNDRLDEQKLRFRNPNLSRRSILASTAIGVAGAGAGLLVGCGDDDDDAPELNGELEVTSLRIAKPPPACQAAQYVAEEYLREEGFTDIEYVKLDVVDETASSTATGAVDFAMDFAPTTIASIDRGADLKILAGLHVGCTEVFARDPAIQSIADLRGRVIGVERAGPTHGNYIFMSAFLGRVGIDPASDVSWKEIPFLELPAALAAGEIDAFSSFPPIAYSVLADGTGHVILDTTLDEPYSNNFCCMLDGNASFVDRYPGATKRVLRSYIHAAEHCAREPDAVADLLVADGRWPTLSTESARKMMSLLPYDVWRRFDPEATVRFYALPLHETGIIERTPEEIIERGTDWRFLDELKEEFARSRGTADEQFSFYCDPETGLPLRTAATNRPQRRTT